MGGLVYRLSGVCALLLVCLLATVGVEAQELRRGGYDLRLFRHAVDSKGLASVNGTEILPHKSYSFGLILDGAFRLVPYDGYKNDSTRVPGDAKRVDYLVDQVFTGVLHFNYGIFDHVIVGAQLPVMILSGPNTAAPGDYNDPPVGGLGYQGLGNLVLQAKWRILRMDTNPVGIAAIMQVGLPTGRSEQFAGEPGVSIWPTIALGYRPLRKLRLNGEVG